MSDCAKVDESNLKQCFTKFDPDQVCERMCFSMDGRDHQLNNEWSADELGNSVGEENFGNISEEENNNLVYMRERRYSWPLLKGVEIKSEVDHFAQ